MNSLMEEETGLIGRVYKTVHGVDWTPNVKVIWTATRAIPAEIFDFDSTLIRRRNFDGRRKSVEKRKNISTVVEKSVKISRVVEISMFFWRRIDVDISTVFY